MKFSYAVTCHKAQGGQWDNVFIDLGYITKERIDKEFMRWLLLPLQEQKKGVFNQLSGLFTQKVKIYRIAFLVLARVP